MNHAGDCGDPARLRAVRTSGAALWVALSSLNAEVSGQKLQRLLASSCDALNVLGTTGEETSLSVKSRRSLMEVAASELPSDGLMVGIGAAAPSDVVELASAAAESGYAAALVLGTPSLA
ncbi:hypothetical protein DTW90_34710 [Neorhizobium sp. P12A]|nr:hypothetical protein DTW90_34710 [Neorhizobium sp. P12A]